MLSSITSSHPPLQTANPQYTPGIAMANKILASGQPIKYVSHAPGDDVGFKKF